MKVEIQKEWYSLEQCKANTNKLYVFGDNAMRIGNGGQAQIRPADNAYGIATKAKPMTDEASYFSDQTDQADIIFLDIKELYDVYMGDIETEFDTIVFPADGLGTGLSEMPKRSPRLYNWLNETISILFGVDFPTKADK
jgi:hypothetical protein